MPDNEDSQNEITLWMQRVSDQPNESMEVIWRNYHGKLMAYAKKKLSGMPRRHIDEEDVATDAMNSLFDGMNAGRFPDLNDRNDLWKLLLTITARRASKAIRGNLAQKRGGGGIRGESIFANVGEDPNAGLGNIMGNAPTPEFADDVVSECEELLGKLDDQTLSEIAVMKLEGFSNAEIAEKLGCAVRSVERKLNRIRAIWEPDVE